VSELCTAADVTGQWAGFADLDAAAQVLLLRAASAAIRCYCRQSFTAATVTDTIDGPGTPELLLSLRPANTITSVTVNGTALTNTNNDAWTLDPDAGILTRGDGRGEPDHAAAWPRGRRNIVVVYTGGNATIPADVRLAAVTLVKHLHDSTTRTGVLSSESIGDYSYVLNTAFARNGAMPPVVAALLGSHVQDGIF
jgi:hypothetical protein